MQLLNLCYTPDPQVFSDMQSSFSWEMSDGIYKSSLSDEQSLYFFRSLSDIELFLESWYLGEIFRCIYINGAFIPPETLYSPGDIILPNTYLRQDAPALFSEYAIGEPYDLEKFQVFLSGIATHDIPEDKEEYYDLFDREVYDFIEYMQQKGYTEKTFSVFEYYESQGNLKNIAPIVEMIVRD